jgi:hypothetical protein
VPTIQDEMTGRLDFTIGAWDCWRNMFGEWGAILSTRCATKEELLTSLASHIMFSSGYGIVG